jgi:hypothetical protein
LIEIGEGAIRVALIGISPPSQVKSFGAGRIEQDSLIIVGEGVLVIGFVVVGNSTVEIGVHIVRLQCDRLVPVGHGARIVALGGVSQTAIVECFGPQSGLS